MPNVNALMEMIKSEVAAECAEYDAVDATRIQEQIKQRPGKHESVKGFYVDPCCGCGPMYLNIIPKNDPATTLCIPPHEMTIFKHKKRAQQAIYHTKMEIKKYNHIPFDNMEICSAEGENKVYHFLDDDSRIWLPSSSLISFCDEEPEPLASRLIHGYFLKNLPGVRNLIGYLERC